MNDFFRSKSSRRAAGVVALTCALSCAPAPAGSKLATGNSSTPATITVREVRTARAALAGWERSVRVSGELVAFEQATLSAKVPGRLAPITFDLGTRVARGDVLARVDPRDYELRVEQALAALQSARARLGLSADGEDDAVTPEDAAIVRGARAQLSDATRERDRARDLLKGGVGAQATVDAAETRVLAAESALQDALEEVQNRRATLAQRRADIALARQQLEDAQVRAPFDGVVAARLAGAGDYLTAGAPIARVLRFDPLRLRLDVPEREAAGIQAGQSVRVLLEGAAEPVTGKLVRTAPELGARNRTLRVEAELANPDGALRPGSFARAEIVVDAEAQTLTVPAGALVRFAGIDKVIVVEGGKAVERRVTVGRTDGARVEVLDGLAAGDEVVLAPGNLPGGSAVRVTH
jgi:RND family efflux transporter MFP subunit